MNTSTTMARIYGLIQAHRTLEKLADNPDTPPEALIKAMDGLNGEIDIVAKSIAAVIKNLEHEAHGATIVAKKLIVKAKATRARADMLRDYLLARLRDANITRVECAHFVIDVCDDEASVSVIDETLIPVKFWTVTKPTVVPAPTLDLPRIAGALRDCEHVPGARIQYTQHLEITP